MKYSGNGEPVEFGASINFTCSNDKGYISKTNTIIRKFTFSGIFPFVATHLKGQFFVFFTVAFLLFLAPAGGSNPAGPIT